MIWLLLGIIFCFFGACNSLQALGDRNATAAVGGAMIGLLFFIIGIPMIIKGARLQRPKKLAEPTSDLRECPHCAEKIQSKAKICRFCGRDVQPLTS